MHPEFDPDEIQMLQAVLHLLEEETKYSIVKGAAAAVGTVDEKGNLIRGRGDFKLELLEKILMMGGSGKKGEGVQTSFHFPPALTWPEPIRRPVPHTFKFGVANQDLRI